MAFSVNSPIGDGVTTQFAVSFTNGLYSRDNVHVFVGDETTERAFTWINDGLIDVQGTVPAVGEVVTIRRIMDKTNKAVDFADGEILDERNLDTMVDQLYNISHEFLDGYGLTEINTDVDMRGNSLTNVGSGDPNDPGSLATIGDLQSAIVSPEDLVDAVRISNNFNDLDDTAVCRTNLDVYSKAEVQEVTQSNANLLINGDFQVWQRGTGPTVTDGLGTNYLADRFYVTGAAGNSQVERNTHSAGDLPVSTPQYYLEHNILLGGASSLRQRIEGGAVLGGSLVTLSFWYKTSIAVTEGLRTVVLGGSYVTLPDIVSTGNTWQKFTTTFTVPTDATDPSSYLELRIDHALTQHKFQISQAKLEKGSVATPFESEPYGDVLAKCQRYYWRGYAQDSDAFKYGISGISNQVALSVVSLPTTLRAAPTVAFLSGTPANCTPNDFSFGFDGFTHRGSVNASGYYRIQTALYEADAEL